ncbi:MAG TPA: sigma-70 family RNA polymerase sigma factor [Propionibacteriaceae bacterium]|nr:sigma-70 family RNA polymerase sigma factor [Propionibacteriaceae bacterium]
MTDAHDVEGLLRAAAPRALGALVRRRGDFAEAEDAMQEALLAAVIEWQAAGPPDDPIAWLVRVADRRLIDSWRTGSARRRREQAVAEDPDPGPASSRDESLELLLLCCHPSLTLSSQIALTLRAVGGLTTEEIAHAFLVPSATIGQRISRAKARLRGARFELPAPSELPERIAAVAAVIYLIFTEGHTASSGALLHRVDLADEAIRLGRMLLALTRAQPALRDEEGEVAGLLALMLLTHARHAARSTAQGELVPLAEQDRRLWDRSLIDEGVALVTSALTGSPLGPYQLQAAIAAVHDEAATADDTDWREVLGLYDLLVALAPSPVTRLNRVVALAMVDGPAAGLLALDTAGADRTLVDHHRTHAVRAHLLEQIGDPAGARAEYELAAKLTHSIPERRHLLGRASHLA